MEGKQEKDIMQNLSQSKGMSCEIPSCSLIKAEPFAPQQAAVHHIGCHGYWGMASGGNIHHPTAMIPIHNQLAFSFLPAEMPASLLFAHA